ncbi:hypothetical protein EZS27_012290, partial [termite gut metagenome]
FGHTLCGFFDLARGEARTWKALNLLYAPSIQRSGKWKIESGKHLSCRWLLCHLSGGYRSVFMCYCHTSGLLPASSRMLLLCSPYAGGIFDYAYGIFPYAIGIIPVCLWHNSAFRLCNQVWLWGFLDVDCGDF